ncbi:MAG: HAMP domain-containing histidine kinase [Chloroflexi bacterium]|nr:HAMP domain-containing histidine kinase [Chloroflexota bacterium]
MSQNLQKPLQAYVVATVVTGGALVSYLASGGGWGLSTLGEAAPFLVLVVVAGCFPLPVAPKVKTDVTTAVLFGAALTLEPVVAALTGAVGIVIYTVIRLHLPWYKYPFNASATAIYVGLASLVFHSLAPDHSLLSMAVAPAAAIMYLANTALVTGAASLQLGANPFRFWWMGTRENGPAEVGLLSFGFLGALAYQQSPWTVLALFTPVAIIYFAFSRLAQANAELEEAMKKLEALQGRIATDAKLASVGALYLDLAHQIKNPLTIAMGRLESLRSRLEDGSTARRHLDIAMEATVRIQSLTENFISVGQKRWVPIDVPTLVNEALGMAGLLNHTRVETRLEYSEGLPQVSGNPVLLRESLTNVFSNALEAVEEDGLIAVAAFQDEGSVVVRISDNGVGIPREMKAHLFEPFRSSKPQGAGVGLFAAKHILEMHEGSVGIESEEGKGTTVTVRLPAVLARNGAEGQGFADSSDILPRGLSQ